MVIRVLFIGAEAAPFVKVGGLGDVAGSLPQALMSLPPGINGIAGIDVRVAIPLHSTIDRSAFKLQPLAEITVPHRDGHIPAEIFTTQERGVIIYLIDSPLIPRDLQIYHHDASLDAPKFIHFSLAALELARELDWQPDILHANDWHTAPAIYALSISRRYDPFYFQTSSLLTIHNLPYLGQGAESALESFGLPPAYDSPLPWWARQTPLPQGLLAADHINTVSPTYAEEMLTEAFGSGLNEFLLTRKESLSGILNGIDTEYWDPATDMQLKTNYNREHLKDKVLNKRALQAELNLPVTDNVPLFGIVSRMDQQKGIDLAIDSLRILSDKPWQVVILGVGQPEIEASAQILANEMPERIRVRNAFDAPFGNRIYGGADAFLIPSRYEPCGLSQMIAMRYGTVPVARATGGLRDTVIDYDRARNRSTGFLFGSPTPEALANAIGRAIAVYGDKRRWRGLQRRGMSQDFSWERSARSYLRLYQHLVDSRKRN